MTKQVFFDPQRKRWKRLRRIFDSLALCSAWSLGCLFIIGLLRMTPLPELLLATAQAQPQRPCSSKPCPVRGAQKPKRPHPSQDHPEALRRDPELGRRSARGLLR